MWRNISAPLNNALAYGLTQALFQNSLSEIGPEMDKEITTSKDKESMVIVEEIDKEIEMDTDLVIETVIDGKENINENISQSLSRENGRLRPKRVRKTVK